MTSHHHGVRVRQDRELLRVSLDRHGIDGALLAELHGVLDLAERSPECRLVVIEGSGGVFCTGMDLDAAALSGASSDELASRGGEEFLGLLTRITTVPRAIVSVVDGRVVGGGVGIAAASDLVYATSRSTFGLPEALWGLLPCCVLPFLIRRVGFQTAHAMTLSTLPVAAERAHRLQLVDELADDVEPLLRRLRARLSKLDGSTISDLKAYQRRMWFLSEDMERAAVAEFTRLMSAPSVRARISAYATDQILPWERRT